MWTTCSEEVSAARRGFVPVSASRFYLAEACASRSHTPLTARFRPSIRISPEVRNSTIPARKDIVSAPAKTQENDRVAVSVTTGAGRRSASLGAANDCSERVASMSAKNSRWSFRRDFSPHGACVADGDEVERMDPDSSAEMSVAISIPRIRSSRHHQTPGPRLSRPKHRSGDDSDRETKSNELACQIELVPAVDASRLG